MKTIIYRGFTILVGACYTKVIKKVVINPLEDLIDQKHAYEFDNQQEAEYFVDQYQDEAEMHPIACEYCGEVGEKVEHNDIHWKTKLPISYVFHVCQKESCKNHRDHDFEMGFEMGKAIAKGEL